ncbi:type I phosphomannose isomerase catalytic subunit [Mangrovimonas sp. DI 80]|uniref:type I phosphomannose isomerase catalytic subunit n=1 Tax=Mangrovimonas sp. DI 80 TaxID=1779330 RepID=UPI0009760EF6|nr:type I phosphomannose isomerase catalytic subunit [Mangrovimonas sp. DI 80]OMP31076.1 mannose-6-phosphate isomerase [Mangrovimonas sp. DI 80]
MNELLYPIKFDPILKDKIWGGEKLKKVLHKKGTSKNVGESWEISDVEGDTSVVANGALKGKTLKQLLHTYKDKLIGLNNYKIFGDKFPLLIKFIDAREDLSIQLHPNDELALKRHNSFGKTEMWYVMQADQGANLIVGFNQKVTPEMYLKHLEKKTLTKILNFDRVGTGDTYFIEVGRLHAIGAGVLLAEIQQTSDVTYRVYDWDRVDSNGNGRELHNDLAIDAIDFDMPDNFRVEYPTDANKSNEMVSCPYFTTNYLKVDSKLEKKNTHDSFIIYMCVEGKATIETEGAKATLVKGETVLMPYAIDTFTIDAKDATLLEVYV